MIRPASSTIWISGEVIESTNLFTSASISTAASELWVLALAWAFREYFFLLTLLVDRFGLVWVEILEVGKGLWPVK